jgi:hypothetical protein
MSIKLAKSIEGVNNMCNSQTHSNCNSQIYEMKDDLYCNHSRTSSTSKCNHYQSNNHINENNHNHYKDNHLNHNHHNHKARHHESIFNLLQNVDIMNDEEDAKTEAVIEKAYQNLDELENENTDLCINEIDNTYDTTSSNPMNDQIVDLNFSNISSSNNPSSSNKSKIIDDRPVDCRTKMQKVMRSPKLHLIVVILVVLDSICVSIELIIDIIITMNEKKELNNNNNNNNNATNSNVIRILNNYTTGSFFNISGYNFNSNTSLVNFYDSNGGVGVSINNGAITQSDSISNYRHRHKSDADSTFILFIIHFEEILKYVGLTILSFFVCEIILKILFIPRDIIKSKWGVFDAFVVFVSFVLDLILLRNKQLLHTVSGLITLLR